MNDANGQDTRDGGATGVVERRKAKLHVLVAIMDNAQTHIAPITYEDGGTQGVLHTLEQDHAAEVLHYKVFRKDAYRVWSVVEEWDQHVPALLKLLAQIRKYEPTEDVTADEFIESLQAQVARIKIAQPTVAAQ